MLSFYLFISLSSYDLIPTSPLLQLEAGRNLKHLLRVLSASSPLQALTQTCKNELFFEEFWSSQLHKSCIPKQVIFKVILNPYPTQPINISPPPDI